MALIPEERTLMFWFLTFWHCCQEGKCCISCIRMVADFFFHHPQHKADGFWCPQSVREVWYSCRRFQTRFIQSPATHCTVLMSREERSESTWTCGGTGWDLFAPLLSQSSRVLQRCRRVPILCWKSFMSHLHSLKTRFSASTHFWEHTILHVCYLWLQVLNFCITNII